MLHWHAAARDVDAAARAFYCGCQCGAFSQAAKLKAGLARTFLFVCNHF